MRQSRFTEEQMVAILREADREPVVAVAKRHAVSEQTLCRAPEHGAAPTPDPPKFRPASFAPECRLLPALCSKSTN